MLSSDKILSFIKKDTPTSFNIQIFETLPSTNDYLRTLAKEGCPEFTVILAREQTAGKGRLGRSFFSPAGSGIYMSVLLKPEIDTGKLTYITPLVAVALVEAIEKITSLRPQIKWVNDIFYNKKKIAGILTETCFANNTNVPDYVIAGCGINLQTPECGYPKNINNIAGSLFGFNTPDDNTVCRLIAEFLCNLEYYYENIEEKPFLNKYKTSSMVINKHIFVISGDLKKDAFALDIDDDFSLVVKYPDETTEKIFTGEVSIRVK